MKNSANLMKLLNFNGKIITGLSVTVLLALFPLGALAAINVNVSELMHQATFFFAPHSGTFIENSTFDVSIYLDSKGESVNTIDMTLRFDPSKLQIVHSLGGRSIIGIWLEPPSYSNTSGTMHLTGTIPNGIVTQSGLITTITFKANVSGTAKVWLSDTTLVLANDGQGSNVKLTLDESRYFISPTPPGGVRVFSETHPYSDHWYNNNNPTFAWEKEEGVSQFSYLLDNKPFTTPDNQTNLTTDTIKGYENLPDGLWYFHIKAKKQGVWGGTTHFLARIDTAPPAQFTPSVDVLSAAVIKSRGLVSFFTTDALSGLDHYEVGVLSESDPQDSSPAFTETEGPYQIPGYLNKKIHIIVRAYDRAGNIQTATASASPVSFLGLLVKSNALTIAVSFGAACLLLLALMMFSRRHIKQQIKMLAALAERHENLLEGNREEPVYKMIDNEELLKSNRKNAALSSNYANNSPYQRQP